MASVLIVVLLAPGEVLSRRNIGTAPRPDVIWFLRTDFPLEGTCFISKKQAKFTAALFYLHYFRPLYC